jgi:PAS domain-containing protein
VLDEPFRRCHNGPSAQIVLSVEPLGFEPLPSIVGTTTIPSARSSGIMGQASRRQVIRKDLLMTQNHDVLAHERIVAGIAEQMRPVLDGSPQGIYIYLDDVHKVCNQRFAEMLGYASPAAWAVPAAFTEAYVEPESWRRLVDTYSRAMEHQVGAVIDVTWKSQGGKPIPSNVILVPVSYQGELLALHFVTPR